MKTQFTHGAKSEAVSSSRQRPTSSPSVTPSMSPSHGMTPDQMLELQSHAGNQEVMGMTQPQSTRSGLPAPLKSGIESLSGMSMDNVNVHNNSAKPAQLQAHAFAQGTDIHTAPGKEKHLPHEAWHVVQQQQGKVKSTNVEL
jgi:hypothetical protein